MPTTSPAAEPILDELSFEQILDRLERVVEELEGGDAPLERALHVFEQGVRLSRQGSQRLDEAERRIELLLKDGETRPLDEETMSDE